MSSFLVAAVLMVPTDISNDMHLLQFMEDTYVKNTPIYIYLYFQICVYCITKYLLSLMRSVNEFVW